MRASLALAVLVITMIAGSATHLTPALSASTADVSVIFGGNGFDMGLGVTDDSGNTYVTGGTESSDFPVSSDAAQARYGGAGDAFVTKIGPDGEIVYSTYLGGGGRDEGRGVAVDSAGTLWVTGSTESGDFPTTGDADATLDGSSDVFVARLAPDGSLASSTLLGGDGADRGLALALDPSGNAYVTGEAAGTDFPTTTDAFDRTPNGDFDAFVTKFSPAGAVEYSSLLGSPAFDNGLAITVDATGSAFVIGKASGGYPVTPGAFDTTQNGGYDMFVTKMSPSGSALAYSTYVGGESWDEGLGIAVDAAGNAYITGNVQSRNYPVTPGAVGGPLKGKVGAAATKLNPDGSDLVYSGVIGGSNWDEGDALAVDSTGAVYIAGHQASSDFPTTEGALDRVFGGDVDGFLTKVDPSGATILYSTFVGGDGWDGAMAMAVDDSGRAYLTGGTSSGDYLGTVTGGSRAGFDVFATIVDTNGAPDPEPEPAFTLEVAPPLQGVVRGNATTFIATVIRNATAPAVTLSVDGLPEGATADLEQLSEDATVITVQTSASTPPGGYLLTITGRSGDVTRTATVLLGVHCCPRPLLLRGP